jgi:glycosyltransferase involved in cell wall biosynthesis
MKIAVVVSHPIQHFCPMYASWAKSAEIELKVFFASNLGVELYNDDNFGRAIKWGNLYLNEFNHHFLNGNVTLPLNSSLDAPSLESELLKFKPNLVIQYGRFYKFNSRLARLKRKCNFKLAYVSDSENRHKENIVKKMAKKIVLPWFFRTIDYFLTVGDSNEAYYSSFGVGYDKMIRMNFSIDIRHYDNCYENKDDLRNEFHKKFNIAKNDIVISVVGKLVHWKNHEDLISLLDILENEATWPRLHLLIAGSGPCESMLKEKSEVLRKNCVHFLGFVDPLNLPEIYAASDVYVHPSRFEPHSLAISEAIYMGLPVVVSDKTGSYGPTDDVRIGLNGDVFILGNIQDLLKKLEFIRDPTRRKELGEFSRIIAKKNQQNAHYQFLSTLNDFLNN